MTTARREFGALDALLAVFLLFALPLFFRSVLLRQPPVGQMIFSVLLFPAAAILAALIRRKPLRDLLEPGRFTIGRLFFAILGTVGITLVLLSLIGPLLKLFPESTEALQQLEAEILSFPKVLAWLLIAILAPVGEEIFFRAALLRGLRPALGVLAAVVLSSAFFAFCHGVAPRMMVTFFVGLWLSTLYLAGGGLALPVIAHAFNNALVLALMFRGMEEIPLWWASVGAVLFMAGALGFAFSRPVQGSRPPPTS